MKKVARNAKTVAVALTALVATLVWILPAGAEGEASADFTVAALSQYIWRGQELSRDSVVIQPSATVSHSGFSANLWGNLDMDPYFQMPGDQGTDASCISGESRANPTPHGFCWNCYLQSPLEKFARFRLCSYPDRSQRLSFDHHRLHSIPAK